MIIETPYKKGDIVSLKLSSGEELVGKFEDETDQQIKIKNPLVLSMVPNGGVGLAPYMMTVDPKSVFKFKSSAVTCVLKTVDDTAKSYIQATSGIQI